MMDNGNSEQASKSSNVVWHNALMSQAEREKLLGAKGLIVWFTGLSGSGKSTVARAVDQRLVETGRLAYLLAGDNLRHGLNGDLGFNSVDRKENIRRVGEVARLFCDASVVVLCSFISPYREDRAKVRSLVSDGCFVEVHVATSLEVCEQRDPKGLYQKARAGQITDFTGITAPYEAPLSPELRLETQGRELSACVDEVMSQIAARL